MIVLFFFKNTTTTELYTLSLHDALPILFEPEAPRIEFMTHSGHRYLAVRHTGGLIKVWDLISGKKIYELRDHRSEEHTSELQSQSNLVCRLLLEKKNKKNQNHH